MDVLKLFQNSADAITSGAGQAIFSQGDEATTMYVVLAGEVEIRHGDRVLERVGPGAIFGELALIRDNRRTASAVAATDCRLMPINERRFLFLVQETPYFALHVMRVLADRLVLRDTQARS